MTETINKNLPPATTVFLLIIILKPTLLTENNKNKNSQLQLKLEIRFFSKESVLALQSQYYRYYTLEVDKFDETDRFFVGIRDVK